MPSRGPTSIPNAPELLKNQSFIHVCEAADNRHLSIALSAASSWRPHVYLGFKVLTCAPLSSPTYWVTFKMDAKETDVPPSSPRLHLEETSPASEKCGQASSLTWPQGASSPGIHLPVNEEGKWVYTKIETDRMKQKTQDKGKPSGVIVSCLRWSVWCVLTGDDIFRESEENCEIVEPIASLLGREDECVVSGQSVMSGRIELSGRSASVGFSYSDEQLFPSWFRPS